MKLYQVLPKSEFIELLRDKFSRYASVSKAEEVASRIQDGHSIIFREVSPSLTAPAGLSIELVQIFASTPGSIGRLHRDGLDRKAALNIPLSGCSKGCVEWLLNPAFKDEELKTVNNEYTKIRITTSEAGYKRHNLEFQESFVLNQPAIIDTDVWHRVNNSDNLDYRFVLSVRFKNNPSFEHLVEALR